MPENRLAWNFFSGEQITYRDLRRVNGLAGAESDRRACTRRRDDANVAAMPLSWLALGLGAVMVPVNVNYLERELAYVINDSHAGRARAGNAWRCSAVHGRRGIRIDPRAHLVVDPPPGRLSGLADAGRGVVRQLAPPEPVAS
jgi:hypothetical protein